MWFCLGLFFQKAQPWPLLSIPGVFCSWSLTLGTLALLSHRAHVGCGSVPGRAGGPQGDSLFVIPFSLQENSHYTDVEDARLQ